MFDCWQLYVKTTDRIFMKILSEMYLWTIIKWLNFGSHRLDQDPEILKIFFLTLQDPGRFSTTGSDAHENVIIDAHFNMKVPITFRKSSDGHIYSYIRVSVYPARVLSHSIARQCGFKFKFSFFSRSKVRIRSPHTSWSERDLPWWTCALSELG